MNRRVASARPCRYRRTMVTRTLLRSAVAALAIAATILTVRAPALAIDTIVFEELKETAVTYGRYNGRFVTCDMQPPVPIRAAFLKHAGKATPPKTLRASFVTWIRDEEAAPEVLKAAAKAMRHKIETADSDRC